MTRIAEIFQRFIGKRKQKNPDEGGKMPNFDDYIYNDQKDQDVIETVILKERQVSFGALAEEYRILWDTLNVRQSRISEIDSIVDKIRDSQSAYHTVSHATHVPWYVVAVIHYLESGLDFSTHLHNGDPLSGYTINEPAGRLKTHEPPFTWDESAIDALTYDGLDAITDWSIEKIAYHLEAFNGFGYRRHHPNVKSPYLWSFSNHYEKGRYVSDNHWSEESVSDQCGGMVLICQMIARGIIASPHMDGNAPFATTAQTLNETTPSQDDELPVTHEDAAVVTDHAAEQVVDSEVAYHENLSEAVSSETQTETETGTGTEAETVDAEVSEPTQTEPNVSAEASTRDDEVSGTEESGPATDVEPTEDLDVANGPAVPTEEAGETVPQQVHEGDPATEHSEVQESSIEPAETHNLVADNTNFVSETVTVEEAETVVPPEQAFEREVSALIEGDVPEQLTEHDIHPTETEESSVILESVDNEFEENPSTALQEIETPSEESVQGAEESSQDNIEPAPLLADEAPMSLVALEAVETDTVSEPVIAEEPSVDASPAEQTVNTAQFTETPIEQIATSTEPAENVETMLETQSQADVSTPEWLEVARGEIGTRDFPGPFYEPRVFTYLQTTLQNPNNDETTWSSAFVNWCMVHSGHSGTNDTNARTWLNYGDVLDEPKPGCIAVLWKGSIHSHNGQVGFFDGFEGNRIRLLGAHAGGGVDWEEVYVSSYPTERVLGYRWPRDHQNELIQAPENLGSDMVSPSDNESL